MAAPKAVKCPTCGRRVVWSDKERWRPFCSERCKLIDLGAWADESYRVPDKPLPQEDDDNER